MSEASGTILKIISSVASPKAAVKFISIAIVLTLSWGYFNELLNSFGASFEHKSLILLFISLGLGSLIGELIAYCSRQVYQNTVGKYAALKKQKEEKLEKIEIREKLLNHFKLTYKHISFSTKEILWGLSKEPQSIWDDSESNIPFRSLLDNGYIKQIGCINDHESLYKLHPDISEYLADNKEKELNEIVESFLKNDAEAHKKLIETITSRDYLPTVDYSSFSKVSRNASPVIDFNVHYGSDFDDFSNSVKGFEVSLNKYFEAILCEKLERSFYSRSFKVSDEEIIAT